MTAPRPDPSGLPPDPGERRLAHPPSDRYRAAEAAAAARTEVDARPVSVGRGIAFAVVAAIATAAAITVLGGVVTITWGLLVVAAFGGWATAWALRSGAGVLLAPGRRALVAATLAVGGVLLGAIGLWLYARTEGGVLPLLDYLDEVFGPIMPVGAILAGVSAYVTAR